MRKAPLAHAVALAAVGVSLSLPNIAHADFIKDSKASLELRNFYMNRDYRQDGNPNPPGVTGKPGEFRSKSEEWAQGFLLRFESGYTDGTVGVGVDALGTLGVKLDSGRGRTGTQILQVDRETGKAQDSYGDAGLTAKLKASKTILKVGTLAPKVPVLQANDSRLLPQLFQGGQISSLDIDNLTLDAGQLKRVNYRDSSDYEEMVINGGGRRGIVTTAGLTSDEFNFASGSYKWNDQLTTAYSYGNLDEFYKQHIVNLTHVLPLADKQSLKSDIRYARSTDDGSHSNVDNKALGAMFTYSLGGHAFGAGYQRMSGDTGFAYVNVTDPFLVNYVQIGDFAAKDEKSWQLRYDYNFAAIGIPGLTFMTRYLNGDDVDRVGGANDGKEWERNMDIGYIFQDGPLKNLGVKWRNATARSNFGNDLDENRLIVSYTVGLW
jgi:hypothetical protein